MDQRSTRIFMAKNVVYTLLLLTSYVVGQTPGLFNFFGVAAMPIIAVVVAIAMVEGEFTGGLFGLLAGILLDTAAFHLFGTASILLLIAGASCGLLIIYLMQSNLRTAILLTGGCGLVYGVVEYYLLYGMWSYPGSAQLLWRETLPCAFFTALWAIPAFFLVRKIHARFRLG